MEMKRAYYSYDPVCSMDWITFSEHEARRLGCDYRIATYDEVADYGKLFKDVVLEVSDGYITFVEMSFTDRYGCKDYTCEYAYVFKDEYKFNHEEVA